MNLYGLMAIFQCTKLEHLLAQYSIIKNAPDSISLGELKNTLIIADFYMSKLDSKIIDLFDECSKLEQLNIDEIRFYNLNRIKRKFNKIKTMIWAGVSDCSD